MILILFQIFIISFLINLLWEFVHCQLYETCLNFSTKQLIPRLIKASIGDGFTILLFFLISVLIFRNVKIFKKKYQILFFIIISLVYAFVWEKISLGLGSWEYASTMPTIFGVGITPLIQLAITGILTFLYVFLV